MNLSYDSDWGKYINTDVTLLKFASRLQGAGYLCLIYNL